ncbi:MAG TPA: class I SAM-dependent methyltransferase [Gaiellaceae bacterium]|nr:class I SAM-dependent methyltransferase [Gaiellaceae bacterium]
MSAPDRIGNLDLSLFDHVVAQTTIGDRRSLLALQSGVRDHLGSFSWLEIGSYLGGTLQPLVVDPQCRSIISIDPRPQLVADDRAGLEVWDYGVENTTSGMLDGLSRIPGADVTKIKPIERGTADIDPGQIARPDFCFVDGEHTRAAALRDARFCRDVLRGRGIIAFHDFQIIQRAVEEFLRHLDRPFVCYLLRTSVFVVELGGVPSLLTNDAVRSQLRGKSIAWRVAGRLGLSAAVVSAHRRLRHR